MSIQKNDKLIEEIQEETIPEKKKRIASQKTLDALALGRKKKTGCFIIEKTRT